MNRKYIYLFVLVGLLLAAQLNAGQTAKPAFLKNIRSLGMGGAGIAAARGSFSYIYNPALLAKEKFSLTMPGFQIEFGENIFEIINFAVENTDNFEQLDKETEYVTQAEKDSILDYLRVEAAQLDNIWYKASVTPFFGVVAKSIGISMYTIVQQAMKTDVGIIIPKMKIKTLLDIVISFGYGYQYSENLALGVGLKYINRRESPEFKIQVEKAAGLGDAFNEGYNEMQKGTSGFGVDIGALYTLNDKLEIAVAAQDLLGKVGSTNTPLNIKLGMMYQYNKNLLVAADLEDFFNRDGDKLVNKIYLGCEYSLPVISLRAGFGQGYPSVGIGLNLWVMDLAYTYYTKEITDSPGQKGESYHLIGLKLGWQ